MLPVRSGVTCCYGVSVGINKSSPAKEHEWVHSHIVINLWRIWNNPNIHTVKAFCNTFSRPCSHLQPFPMSQISIRPSKEVVARLPSLRKTQLEIPSQLLTSDFTSCQQPPEVMLDIVETDVQHKIFKMGALTCHHSFLQHLVVFKTNLYMKPGNFNSVYCGCTDTDIRINARCESSFLCSKPPSQGEGRDLRGGHTCPLSLLMICSIPCPVPTTISCPSKLITRQVGSEEKVDTSSLPSNTQDHQPIAKRYQVHSQR